MRIRWSLGVALGFAMGSCSEPAPPETPPLVEEGTASEYLTSEEMAQRISSADYTFGFESRDHQLWLHTGTDPQLYTVKTEDGEVVAEAIDDARLKLDYPDLHDIVHNAVDLIGIGD